MNLLTMPGERNVQGPAVCAEIERRGRGNTRGLVMVLLSQKSMRLRASDKTSLNAPLFGLYKAFNMIILNVISPGL